MAEVPQITDHKIINVKMMFKKESTDVDLSYLPHRITMANTRKAAQSETAIQKNQGSILLNLHSS